MVATLYDKNKVFFALIHYILSEQKNVNWILKTSLIDFTGISSLLEEKPYAKDSILNDVVDYVTEIKPYHVQFSHYFEHYQTASETVAIPGNDWLEPTINLRFDSIQSTPDIIKTFDSVYSDKEHNFTPPYPVKSEGETEEEYQKRCEDYDKRWNENGLTIYSQEAAKFFVRVYHTDRTWSWEESDEVVADGYYFTTNQKGSLYKCDTTVMTKIEKGSKLYNDFLDSHRANRLFALGLHDYDEIKKELNANFKGIEVNGSVFDMERFGYDIFNYDTTDYDSPTIIYDYCFMDYTEDFSQFPLETGFTYKKVISTTTEHRFSLPSNVEASSGYKNVVYKVTSNGHINIYDDYEMSFSNTGNYIDIFTNIGHNEKIYITKEVDNDEDPQLNYAYVIEGNSFNTSDSDILHKEFVEYTADKDMYLTIPMSDISADDKIAIQIKSLDGSRKPYSNITSYTIKDGKLRVLPTTIRPQEHIIMTVFDYKYLYDKIYMWEDKYGRSNNIVNLDGKTLLRPRYEEDRPSEKVVSYPLTSFFAYNQNDSKNSLRILYNNYKNDMFNTIFNTNYAMHITNIIKNEDKSIDSIELDSVKILNYPNGKILVNSEIIEYSNVDKETNIISGLKRGIYGTPVYNSLIPKYFPKKKGHGIGDIVYPYVDEEWIKSDRNNVYKSYNISNPLVKTYTCPTGYTKSSEIELYKNNKISLLEDVRDTSTEILLNSPNVVFGSVENESSGLPKPLYKTIQDSSTKRYTGEFSVRIDEDIIPFTTIYKDPDTEGVYHLQGITLPEKYKNTNKVIYTKDNSFVYSAIPEEIDTFTISFIEGDMTNDIVEETEEEETKTYVETVSGEKLYHFVNIKKKDDTYVYAEVYRISQEYDGWSETFKNVETSFGLVENNKVYKNDGTLIAKIEGDKFIEVQTIITLLENPIKHESIHINVIN